MICSSRNLRFLSYCLYNFIKKCQYYLKSIIPKPCFWQILSESVPPLPIAQVEVCRRLAGKELWGFEPLFYRLERSTCRLYYAVDSTLPVEKSTCRFNSGTLLHRGREGEGGSSGSATHLRMLLTNHPTWGGEDDDDAVNDNGDDGDGGDICQCHLLKYR